MRSAVVVAAALGLLSASAAGAEARTLGAIVPDLPNAHVAVHHPRAHAAADLPYGGGPVLHNNRTHLIFWQPAGTGMSFDPRYEAMIEQFHRVRRRDGYVDQPLWNLLVDSNFFPAVDLLADKRASRVTSPALDNVGFNAES